MKTTFIQLFKSAINNDTKAVSIRQETDIDNHVITILRVSATPEYMEYFSSFDYTEHYYDSTSKKLIKTIKTWEDHQDPRGYDTDTIEY